MDSSQVKRSPFSPIPRREETLEARNSKSKRKARSRSRARRPCSRTRSRSGKHRKSKSRKLKKSKQSSSSSNSKEAAPVNRATVQSEQASGSQAPPHIPPRPQEAEQDQQQQPQAEEIEPELSDAQLQEELLVLNRLALPVGRLYYPVKPQLPPKLAGPLLPGKVGKSSVRTQLSGLVGFAKINPPPSPLLSFPPSPPLPPSPY